MKAEAKGEPSAPAAAPAGADEADEADEAVDGSGGAEKRADEKDGTSLIDPDAPAASLLQPWLDAVEPNEPA